MNKIVFQQQLPDLIFDHLYSSLVLNNKQFENEYDPSNGKPNPAEIDLDLKSLRKLYLNSKRHESDPVYAKHLVLYFFRRLLLADDCDDCMRQNPKLLVKCLFGLIQVHLEYGSYFSLDDLSTMLVARIDSFEEQLVAQWLCVYVGEWSDEYDLVDDSGLLHDLVTSRFPLRLFGCCDSHVFMDKYVHLVFEHFLTEFDRLPRGLSSNER